MGVPFVPVRGLYGSDLMRTRPDDFKLIDDPFRAGETVVVAPALRPDLFITHGAVGDRWGNVVTTQDGRNDLLAAQASKCALITVEEFSETPLTPAVRPGWIFIPAYHVTAVVLAPHGSFPAGFTGLYEANKNAMWDYARAGWSDEQFAAYRERHVVGYPSLTPALSSREREAPPRPPQPV